MRKVLFIALFVGLLLQTSSVTLFAASGLEMNVQPGFGGRFKYGEWLPVFVELENSGPDLLGEIQVVITGPTGQLDFTVPAELPSGARKRYTLYILPNNFSRSAKVELVVDGEVQLTRQIKLSVIPNDRYVIGAVAVNVEGLAAVNPPQLAGRRERADMVNLSLAELPERHEGWRMLNALILNDVDTSSLTPAQRTALSRWVAEGGRLVVGGGVGAGRTLAGLPAELQPVTLVNQLEVATLPGLERYAGKPVLVPGPFLIAQAQPVANAAILLNNEAKAEISDDNALALDSALIVELPFGAGYVDFIALDLSQSPFNAWAGVTGFVETLLSPGAAWPQYLAADVAPQQMSDSQMYYALTNLPALDLPSIRFLGLLLAGYIILVGPVNYLVLRWRDRLAWAWVTIPLVTLIFSGLAYGLGFGLRGSDIIINQVSIIELGQSNQAKRAQTYVGIFSPRRQSYDIQVNAETLLRPLGQGGYDPWSGSVNTGGSMRVSQSNPARLQGLTVDQWSMQSFVAETLPSEQLGLVVQLTAERDGLWGQVENRSNATWEDVIFIFNAQFQKLGDLAPGQTAEIHLDFQNSAPVISGFGSYVLYQEEFNQSQGPGRDVTFKQSVLDGTIFNGNRPDLTDRPILIAWQKNNSPLDINLEGYQTNTQATTLLYHPLALDFDSDQVVIPPGFSQLELLSVSGDASTCNYGTGLDGSYVYQGTAETKLSLPSQLYRVQPQRLDLYIRTDGSWPNLPTIELYDRTAETWVALENAKTGSNPIRDTARFYNPDDASLQVRISNNGGNGGGCLFLDMALEGERYMTTPHGVIETQQLTKRYGRFTALDNLDLRVEAGALFGFIGPNGAGKTTTLRMLAGLLEPSSGQISLNGQNISHDVTAARWLVGYMPDFFGVYEDMKVWEYLDFFARCYRLDSKKRARVVSELLELVDLASRREAWVESLSRGMRQRLCLAHALVHDPQILLLDEPASGLDPRARIEMRELLKELSALGKTIIISSHILTELAEMCNQVGIIEHGRLLYNGPPQQISQQQRGHRQLRLRTLATQETIEAALNSYLGVTDYHLNDDGWQVNFSGDDAALAGLLAHLVEHKIPVIHFSEETSNLEAAFMQITTGEVK